MTWTAVVLAGGRGSRLGGLDKARLTINGEMLIERAIRSLAHESNTTSERSDGVPAAQRPAPVAIIVVGPVVSLTVGYASRSTPPPALAGSDDDQGQGPVVHYVREHPEFGGPVAAIAAALPLVRTPLIGVLAVDMPYAAVLLDHLFACLAASEEHETAIGRAPGTTASAPGAVACDGVGRIAPVAVLRTPLLRQRIASFDVDGGPANRSLRALVDLPGMIRVTIPEADTHLLSDIDTPEDLDNARRGEALPGRGVNGDLSQR